MWMHGGREALLAGGEEALVRVVGRQDVGEDREEDEEAEDYELDPGVPLREDVPYRVAPEVRRASP